jgi:hypothetical protein
LTTCFPRPAPAAPGSRATGWKPRVRRSCASRGAVSSAERRGCRNRSASAFVGGKSRPQLSPTAIWQVPLESVCRSAEPPRCPASPFPKHQQGISLSSPSIMRLGLVQGLVRISQELGLTHWCAVMEPSLLRLLRRTAIHFEPLAPRRTITAFVSLVAPPSTRSLPGWPGNAQRCGPS